MAITKLKAVAVERPTATATLDLSDLDVPVSIEPDPVRLEPDQLTPEDEDLLVLLEAFLSLTDGRPRPEQVDSLADALDIPHDSMRELLQSVDLDPIPEDDDLPLVASADLNEDDFVPPEGVFDDDEMDIPDKSGGDSLMELGPLDESDDEAPGESPDSDLDELTNLDLVDDTDLDAAALHPVTQPDAIIKDPPELPRGDDPDGLKKATMYDGESSPDPKLDDILVQNDGEQETPGAQNMPKDGELINP